LLQDIVFVRRSGSPCPARNDHMFAHAAARRPTWSSSTWRPTRRPRTGAPGPRRSTALNERDWDTRCGPIRITGVDTMVSTTDSVEGRHQRPENLDDIIIPKSLRLAMSGGGVDVLLTQLNQARLSRDRLEVRIEESEGGQRRGIATAPAAGPLIFVSATCSLFGQKKAPGGHQL